MKPAKISADASVVWDELAPIGLAMGTLTRADVRAFWVLCELQATFEAIIAAKGAQDFDQRAERDTAAAVRSYLGLFGMEPVSRAKIQVPKTSTTTESKWAGALK